MTLLLVAIGGFFGAIARYLVDFRVASRVSTRLPLGTLVVNVSGSLALGILVGTMAAAGGPEWVMTLLGAGFLAAYTTFSTWMFETARLSQRGAIGAAVTYVAVTAGVGIAAAAAGLLVGVSFGRLL
ncbi:MAG TPA: fluoride efflux transporter CrcB [Longimicrobiales bacterium]|nr:fluoride efflux transporter CrcB [Longimicrobiales bacterium]